MITAFTHNVEPEDHDCLNGQVYVSLGTHKDCDDIIALGHTHPTGHDVALLTAEQAEGLMESLSSCISAAKLDQVTR